MGMNDVWRDFDKATPDSGSGGGTFLPPGGEHVVKIREVKFKPSDKTEAEYYIVEFNVVETDLDSVKTDVIYTWMQNRNTKHYGYESIKQFLASAMGLDPKGKDAMALGGEEVQDSYSDEQPLADALVNVTTRHKDIKATGKPFTVHIWGPHEAA